MVTKLIKDSGPGRSNRDIFSAALDIADEQLRQAFVERACAGDSQRLEAIRRLLAAQHAQADSPLDQAIAQLGPSETLGLDGVGPLLDISNHPVIDHYKLLEQIGEGGMGAVFMAQQTEPIRRRVALKLIKPGMDSRQVIARFEAERQVLAMMDHPNIPRVLDAGTTAEGRPYFVMELVHGIPITDYCDQNCLSIDDRLRLFINVCRAVQHAHQKGIIHRDLKPSNVMITLHDGVPVVKVIDFGVAKALNQELCDRTLFTQFSQMIGTPLYMSPEQAEMSGLDIDTRSDVYSLGILLYELLTGVMPFDKESFSRAGFDEMRRIIREDEPSRPSHKLSTLDAQLLSTVSNRRNIEGRQLAFSMRRELDWIAMKALEKDRNRRYESTISLADDLQRYLDDEPVAACPPSAAYRLRKLARRRKRALAAAILIVITLLAGTAAATWQAIRATKAEIRAEALFESERDARGVAEQAHSVAEASGVAAEEARQEAEQRTVETRRLLSHSYVAAGATQLQQEDFARSLPWFVEALRVDVGEEQLESIHRTRVGMVLQQCPKLIAVFDTGMPVRRGLAGFNALDRAIACRVSGRMVQVYDVVDNEPIGLPLQTETTITDGELSPDGRYLHIIAEGRHSLLEVGSGRLILTSLINEVARKRWRFSLDGTLLAMLSESGEGLIWETKTGRLIAARKIVADAPLQSPLTSGDATSLVWSFAWYFEQTQPPILNLWTADGGMRSVSLTEHVRFLYDVRFSHDGTRFVTASFDSTARIWDAATLEPTPALDHEDYVIGACFSPDDKMVVTVSGDHTARLWDVRTGQPLTPPLRHDGELMDAAFSRDGRYLVTASWDTTARIWDTKTGRLAFPILTHHTQVTTATFDASARRVMTVTADGLVHVWDLSAAHPPGILIDNSDRGYFTAFTPDGKAVLTTGSAARMWDVETGQPLSPPLTHEGERVWSGIIGFQGRRIATQNASGVQVWDGRTFQAITPLLRPEGAVPTSNSVTSPSFGFNDAFVLAHFNAIGSGGPVQIWDVETGESMPIPVTEIEHVTSATYSPDGRYIATGRATSGSVWAANQKKGQKNGSLELWDGRSGTLLRTLMMHDDPLLRVTFSRDSSRLAAVSGAVSGHVGEVHVWDVATGNLFGPAIQQSVEFEDLDFSPDGRRIVTAARNQTAQIWDVASGQPLTPPMYHKERVEKVRYSPDGRFVATTTGVGNLNSQGPASARLWNAATGQPIAPPLRHSDASQIVRWASFSPDGLQMATVGRDRTTRIWTIASEERPVEDLILLAQVLSSRKFDATSSLAPISREEKLATWRDLRSRYPEWFTTSPEQVLAWQHRQAVHCMKTSRWPQAVGHLNHLIEVLPAANVGLRLRRAECAIQLADWATAAEDFEASFKGDDSYHVRYKAALAALGGKDHGLHRELGIGLLERYAETDEPTAANFAVWTLALAPGALDDYTPAIALARRAVAMKPDDRQLLDTLGAILLRADQHEAAREQLLAAIEGESANTSTAYAHYLLAITEHHLGNPAEARKWLDKANESADAELESSPPWNRRITLELFREEATALIGNEASAHLRTTPARSGETPEVASGNASRGHR